MSMMIHSGDEQPRGVFRRVTIAGKVIVAVVQLAGILVMWVTIAALLGVL